jgi:hypothetical protein
MYLIKFGKSRKIRIRLRFFLDCLISVVSEQEYYMSYA